MDLVAVILGEKNPDWSKVMQLRKNMVKSILEFDPTCIDKDRKARIEVAALAVNAPIK